MSSKKIATSMGLKEWILKALDDEAEEKRRSRSDMLGIILEERYKPIEGSMKGEHNGAKA